MRSRAPEDMSEQEYNDLKYDNQTTNPYRRCVCANQNNDDGSCSYCEWEEEHATETDTRSDELSAQHNKEDMSLMSDREDHSALLPSQHGTGSYYGY